MKVEETTCTLVEERDLVVRYMAGRLPEEEAEAFEAHYLTCEKCSRQAFAAGEIREALGDPFIASPAESWRKTSDFWSLAAAAAVVAVFLLGYRELATKDPGQQTAYRGEAADLRLAVDVSDPSRVRISWPDNTAAQTYIVRVQGSSGETLWSMETQEVSVTVDRAVLKPQTGHLPLLARVQALDPTGMVIATSPLTPVPEP